MKQKGKFIISLDFELLWGVRDIQSIETYGENILGVWEAIPKMLETFDRHQIKATFATVGFLFASSKSELQQYVPELKPNYSNKNLSPYNGHFDLMGEDEEADKYHFATRLIQEIQKYPEQEIATHTFSHYYCLEKGQTKEQFEVDIIKGIDIAKKYNITLKSLVFPRNQYNDAYLEVIKKLGITSFRGNEKAWFYSASEYSSGKLLKRANRLLDAYLNLSGHNSYPLDEIRSQSLINIPSSRFLRPYSPKLKYFEKLRLNRILKSMTHAAKNNEIYHLWWHPHNFGAHQDENFKFLNKILAHYIHLKKTYGFESITMKDLSQIIRAHDNG